MKRRVEILSHLLVNVYMDLLWYHIQNPGMGFGRESTCSRLGDFVNLIDLLLWLRPSKPPRPSGIWAPQNHSKPFPFVCGSPPKEWATGQQLRRTAELLA